MRAAILGVCFLLMTALNVQASNGSNIQQPNQAPQGAPDHATMHKLLTKRLWAASYGEKKTYQYQSIRYHAPIKYGNTVHFPVSIMCDVTTHFPDGVSRTERKHELFEFYRDQHGFWEFYRIREID